MKPLVYASAFLLLGFCSCKKEQLDKYYVKAEIDLGDWMANEFEAELYDGDFDIVASSEEYILTMDIWNIGTASQYFVPKIKVPNDEDIKFILIESTFTLHSLDTVNQEVTASFRFVVKRKTGMWNEPVMHIEDGEFHIPYQFIPLPPVYCEVVFEYDPSVNERFGQWRLVHIVDKEENVLLPPCDYEVRLQLTEHDEWVQTHYPGFTGGIKVKTDCNASSFGFRMINDTLIETTIEFYNTGLGCSDAVQENEEKIREVLYRDTVQITYDHNLLFLENEKGTTLHFYYDPE